MKKIFLLLLLTVSAASAQVRMPLEGKVTAQEEGLENVHIRNVTSHQFSVSDANGRFSIKAAVGDTLLFTHISMLDLVEILTKEDLVAEFLPVTLLPRDQELEEVLLDLRPEINVVDLGIISEKKEIPTTYERRLQTAGDFKWYHIFGLLTGNFQVDPLLNAINGRTRKMKRNLEVEQKIETMDFLTVHYMDYMKATFEVPEADVQRFLDYLVEQEGLKPVMDTGKEEGLQFYLMDQWIRYGELSETEGEKGESEAGLPEE